MKHSFYVISVLIYPLINRASVLKHTDEESRVQSELIPYTGTVLAESYVV